ncbi:MAG TPA: hypothetical protein PLL10_05895 [Elusimicrobiales bacterium]|nr:hypothetical protein [Elusimicrobiales bacterium]
MADNTVLLVEDNAELSASLKSLFQAKGIPLQHYTECASALADLEKISPRVIILNMLFNKKAEGILAARKLRRNKQYAKWAKVPLIMLSDLRIQQGVIFPKPSRYPYALPVDEFIQKPVKPDIVLAKAEEFLKA